LVAGAHTLYLPVVAAFLALVFVLFERIHTTYPAADRGAARVAVVATVTAIRVVTASPLPGPTKAWYADVLRLHKPAMLFHFFFDEFGATSQFASAAATIPVGVVVAASAVATCESDLLVCLFDGSNAWQ